MTGRGMRGSSRIWADAKRNGDYARQVMDVAAVATARVASVRARAISSNKLLIILTLNR